MCSTQACIPSVGLLPVLTATTFCNPARANRSRKPSRPQHETPPSRRTAQVRPREAEISVSLLRGPSTIENEPASGWSGWSGWWSRPRDMSVAIWARDTGLLGQ